MLLSNIIDLLLPTDCQGNRAGRVKVNSRKEEDLPALVTI